MKRLAARPPNPKRQTGIASSAAITYIDIHIYMTFACLEDGGLDVLRRVVGRLRHGVQCDGVDVAAAVEPVIVCLDVGRVGACDVIGLMWWVNPIASIN